MKKLILAGTLFIAMSSPVYAAYVPPYERTVRTTVDDDGDPNTMQYTYAPITGNYGNQVGDESRIDNLDHGKYYTWGMDLDIDLNNVTITAASITFAQIKNWDKDAYNLWVRLLEHKEGDDTKPVSGGVKRYFDDDGTEDDLDGNGIFLYNFVKPEIPGWDDSPKTITYEFNGLQVGKLNDYAAIFDGIIGLGFDPDCHFYNDGVSFSITVTDKPSEVPEPATMLLFGTGLAGLAGFRMRKKKH